MSTALGKCTWELCLKKEKKNAESVCLESGSFVFQAVMKSLLSFLAESLSAGRNDVKVSTAAVNFTPSESNCRSRFVFFPLFGRGRLTPMTHRLLCVASRSRQRRA